MDGIKTESSMSKIYRRSDYEVNPISSLQPVLSPTVYLSYLQITSSLNSSTPNLVVHQIAESHGIICDVHKLTDGLYRLAIIYEIHNQTTPTVDLQNMTGEDYRYLARFVNPACHWTISTLREAFNNIRLYFHNRRLRKKESQVYGIDSIPGADRHLNSMSSNFIIGRPTPKLPNRLSIIILYGVCRYYNLTIHPKDNLKSLAKKLRLYFDFQINELRTSISSQLHKINSKNHLVNLLSLLDSYLPIDTYYQISDIDFNELNKAGKRIYTDRFKRQFVPINRVEIIAYSALTYQLDFSNVKNIEEELKALQMKKYHPMDSILVERFNSQYPRLDSPNLKLVFNPKLPRSCYLPKYLEELAYYEGFRPADSDEYGFLQQTYLSKTFHHGKLPNITNQETMLEEELISSLSFHQVICYGIRQQTNYIISGTQSIQSSSNQWYAYTYKELLFCFSEASVYQDPTSVHNESFSPLAVYKLLSLVEQSQYEDESKSDYQIRQDLAKRIHYIDLITHQLSPEANELLNIYRIKDQSEAHQKNAETIKNLLYQLRNLGFYMRGWKGTEEFPVSRTNVKDMTKVETRTVDFLAKFEHSCSHTGNIGQLILNLPLMEYKGKVFIPSQKKEDGLTIKERLHIIKHGDEHYNENASCIRVTSNRFVATAYRYLTILDLDPGFKIEDLVIIF